MKANFYSIFKSFFMMAMIATLLCFIGVSSASATTTKGYRVYHGEWFDIEYPDNFKVKPSMRSCNECTGYDSAFFTSPDGSVEFYVFSPLWSGMPWDILLNPKTEVVASTKRVQNKDSNVLWYTIRHKKNLYSRSYEKVYTQQTARIIGLKYKDQKSYNKYKNQYLHFKKSLIQYAD